MRPDRKGERGLRHDANGAAVDEQGYPLLVGYRDGGYVGPRGYQAGGMVGQPAPAHHVISPEQIIGPSQQAMTTLDAIMAQPIKGWGSGLAHLGAAFAKKHHGDKLAKAKTEREVAKQARRQRALRDLESGMDLRAVVARDPGLAGDKDFLGFLQDTAPTPGFEPVLDDAGAIIGQRGPDGRVYDDPRAAKEAPETFSTESDPFGLGGVGQRSSVSGKIVNYQPRPKAGEAKGRAMKQDVNGRWRFVDDRSFVFPDTEKPKTNDLPKFENVKALADEWQESTRPVLELQRQRDLMQIGLQAARRGDMAAGSQAVLVTMNKVLDPTSVVRESEYARSATGMSLWNQVKGAYEKLEKGGAGVTLPELEAYARFADEAVEKLGGARLTGERARIGRFADAYGIERDLIFGGSMGATPQAPVPATGGGAGGLALTSGPITPETPQATPALPPELEPTANMLLSIADPRTFEAALTKNLASMTPDQKQAFIAELKRRRAAR